MPPAPLSQATDDRAHPIIPLRPAEVRRTASQSDPQRAALARHLDAAITAESQRLTLRGFGLTMGLVVLWITALVFINAAGSSLLKPVRIITFWGGLALVSLAGRAAARRRIASQLAATAVAEGICGSCCYSLQDLPTEPDGCLVCPECGAAWNHTRITRPHWIYPAPARSTTPLRRLLTFTPPPASLLAPDSRGRYVPILDSRLVALSASHRKALGPLRRARLVSRLRAIGRVRRLLLAAAPTAIIGYVVWAEMQALQMGQTTLAAILAGVLAILVVLALMAFLGHGFIRPRKVIPILLSQGLCPSCGKLLNGCPAAQDGSVVCPGCGSAWQQPVSEQTPT